MTPSKTLFYLCISFVAGIAISSVFKIPQSVVWGIFVLGMAIIIIAFALRKNVVTVLGFCVLVLVLGIMRFQISQFTVEHDALSKLNDAPEKITLVGTVSGEPDVRDNLQKLKVKVGGSIVLVTLGAFSEGSYQYLDTVKITGKLKTPAVFDDFNYKNYLVKDNIYSVMDYPKIELVSKKHNYTPFTFLYEKILFLKSTLLSSIDKNLSPPHSFMLEGMVFGDDKHLSKDLKDQFNATGLSHVTAVSGSNIVVVISLLMIFLLAIGFWRGQAFYIAVIFIWIYIVLIGFPASGVRAAIMGCIALLAQKLGRQNATTRVLTLAGVLMLVQNPLLLLYDVGFQLSFLASLGIIHIKPLIDIFLKMITKGYFKFLTDLVAITLAAQIITLPIIVYNFGTISLIAPISNVLVLPAVEILTPLGFLLAIAGAIFTPLGFILAVPCWFLLTYFMKVLDIFSQPWAVATIEHVSWIWVVVYYIALVCLIWYFNKFKKPKFLGY